MRKSEPQSRNKKRLKLVDPKLTPRKKKKKGTDDQLLGRRTAGLIRGLNGTPDDAWGFIKAQRIRTTYAEAMRNGKSAISAGKPHEFITAILFLRDIAGALTLKQKRAVLTLIEKGALVLPPAFIAPRLDDWYTVFRDAIEPSVGEIVKPDDKPILREDFETAAQYIGAKLRAAREAKGLSHSQVAKKLETSKKAVWNVESGAGNTGVNTAERYAALFGIDIFS